jgi:hypothetical protein
MARVNAGPTGVEREYVSVQEASVMSGLSPWTWRAWSYQGKISTVKLGTSQRSRLLIPISEVRRVMEDGLRPRIESAAKRP